LAEDVVDSQLSIGGYRKIKSNFRTWIKRIRVVLVERIFHRQSTSGRRFVDVKNDPDKITLLYKQLTDLKSLEKYREVDRDASEPVVIFQADKKHKFDTIYKVMKTAAMAGYPQAQYEMARRYRTRKRTEQEEQQAVDWLAAAVESDHRGAMVDLGVIYLQGIRRIGLERNPYRSKALFEQALHDREDTVYAQQTGNGRGWKYTVESVNRWLDKIPESVRRLDLEGLQDPQRQQAIDQWYAEEQQALQAQTPAPEGEALALLQKQLDALEQQRTILQKDL